MNRLNAHLRMLIFLLLVQPYLISIFVFAPFHDLLLTQCDDENDSNQRCNPRCRFEIDPTHFGRHQRTDENKADHTSESSQLDS